MVRSQFGPMRVNIPIKVSQSVTYTRPRPSWLNADSLTPGQLKAILYSHVLGGVLHPENHTSQLTGNPFSYFPSESVTTAGP